MPEIQHKRKNEVMVVKKFFEVALFVGMLVGILALSGCATEFNAPISRASAPIARSVYAMPDANSDIIGQTYKAKIEPGDTFTKIAEKYDVGAQELLDANPHINPARLAAGSSITIPAEFILPPAKFRKGIVINIAEMRLYYFNKQNNTVMTFPIAVGREGWATPLSNTYVYRKAIAPTWNVPKSIRAAYLEKTGTEHPSQIGPGPNNPLGDYAIYLHLNGYLIHGNNDPATIGRRVSSGCIRMFNQDVGKLYDYVNRGTPVEIIYYSSKAGWLNGKLYLESHRILGQPDAGNSENNATPTAAVKAALAEHSGSTVNWQTVEKVVQKHRGIPTQIGMMSSNG